MTGQITTSANSAWRDYVTPGVPSTGRHEPVKSEIRGVFAIIQSVVDTLGLALTTQAKYYDTRANLYVDLTPEANSIGVVGDDPTPAYRGFYQKVGGTGTGSWSYIEGLALPATFAEDLADLVDRVAAIEDAAVSYNSTTNALTTGDWSIIFINGEVEIRDAALYAIPLGAGATADEELAWEDDELQTPRWSQFVRDGQLILTDPELYEFPAYGASEPAQVISESYYAWLDDRMHRQSADLREIRIFGLAAYGPGLNLVLGVGQSFMAASVTAARIQLTATRLLADVDYVAVMIGDADRCKSSGATYDYFGSLEFNPLVETVVSGASTSSVVVSQADIDTGTYPSNARGATPLPGALITFEHLWRQHNQIDVPDTSRFDVAANVAKGESLLADISTGDGLARTLDAILVAEAARAADTPSVTDKRLSCVLERHGQADEAAGTAAATYQTAHRLYRENVHTQAVTTFAQVLRAPWIATQVSGAYGQTHRTIANLQLSMALDKGVGAVDDDYFLATPDYPFPHFRDVAVETGHPHAENAHPTAMGNQMVTDYFAWCRFFVQVMRRNWFPTHMGEAYYSGRYILVGFRAMQPPLRVSEVVVSLTMRMIEHFGFDVTDASSANIVNVQQVGDLAFLIECDDELTAPTVGLAKGDRNNWPALYGASNIRDSQTAWTLFEQVFEDGYTNLYRDAFDDTNDLEDIPEILGKQDMGNWAASQTLVCEPLPLSV